MTSQRTKLTNLRNRLRLLGSLAIFIALCCTGAMADGPISPIVVTTADPALLEEARLTTDGIQKGDPVVLTSDEIVYTVLESAVQTSLFSLRTSDNSSRRLYPNASTSEFESSFSSDGRFCAFVQSRGNLNLILVIRDRRENRDSVYEPGGGFTGVRHPWVKPDGGDVLFSLACSGGQHILRVGINGTNPVELTRGESLNLWPSYSHDGARIVFGSDRDGDFEIYSMLSDGSDIRRLTQLAGRDMRPRWSPDGRRIAFVSHHDDNGEIYLMNADGSNLVRLTTNAEQDDFPAWSPDGKHLVYVSEREGEFDLYQIRVPAP